jgi:YgiT-type zinc finger domain-containing protein
MGGHLEIDRFEEKEMKCVICKSSDIQKKMIEEEIKSGMDIVLVAVEALVCMNCGERYYDRKTMRKIEDVRLSLTYFTSLDQGAMETAS